MYAQNKSVLKIAAVNPALADKIAKQGTFLTEEDVPEVQKIDRLMLVLVRCGNGRFLCPVQDVTHFINIIEEHSKLKEEKIGKPLQGDHIRDVSFPAS
jgi:hypothetical protein